MPGAESDQRDLATLVPLLEESTADLRVDALAYLLPALAPEEREILRREIAARGDAEIDDALADAMDLADSASATQTDELRSYLRLLSEGPARGEGKGAYGFGRAYWENVKARLVTGLCKESEEYGDLRRQLRQGGRTSIVVAVPVIMSYLHLPPELSGFAIIVGVFSAKLGIDALCDTLRGD